MGQPSAGYQEPTGRSDAVVAIFGQESSIGGFRLIGSGAIVADELVLTARHVVDARPDSRFKIRVYSPAGGIATLDRSHDVPFRHPVEGAGIVNDIALLRLQSPIEGIEPAQFGPAGRIRPGAPCTIPGFGGRKRGLLEERRVEVVEADAPAGDRLIRFRLPPQGSLRSSDSGAPVFHDGRIVGVYFGRDDRRRPVAAPLDAQLVAGMTAIRDRIAETTAPPARFTRIDGASERAVLGIGETREHFFEFPGPAADLGVMALNGAALAAGAEEEDVRFRVELHEPDGQVRSRDFESQFQTFWRRLDRGVEAGTYRLAVTATATAAVYDVNWSMYRRA